ncbi:cyclic nucleotide-binding domain-containing protein [Candidatus Uhrbacteria bacterium]|nr:cyclic nucleotide-binding domain-containing protein [Candidatus Uhrbacteria bacterium]MBD3284486.1 cyclic nucleotide-binding domain-containing protein [Candidatus Uhrbacteria bacterium]
MDTAWYIRQLPIFEDIPKSALDELLEGVRDETYDRPTMLYTPNYAPDARVRGVYLVKQGEVNLYHAREGKRFIFETIGPGGVFGNFDPQTNAITHSAEAQAGTRTCFFTSADFVRILATYPSALFKTLGILATRIREYEKRLGERTGDAKEKIINELRRHHERILKPTLTQLFRFEAKKLTHEKLAERTGLNRVTVTRAIRELIAEGIICHDEDRNEITFCTRWLKKQGQDL